MRYEIIIDSEDAAMVDDPAGQLITALQNEIVRIATGRVFAVESATIRDTNGNAIGEVSVSL